VTAAAIARPQQTFQHHALRFFKSPKGLLLIILGALTVIALPKQGVEQAVPEVLAAMAIAGGLDAGAIWLRRQRSEFPSGAILTGLIIALVLRPQESLSVVMITCAIAIATKQLLRTRWSNIFNPAALALVASSFLFSTGQSWWGALPDLGIVGFAVLLGAGLFIADRINKLPLVIAFLAGYFCLFTFASFIGKPVDVAEIFRTPDLQASLFFAFFMLDDPPTCPIHYEDQITFALVVALVSFLVFVVVGAVYFLPAGLLAGNAWESARRQFHHMFRKPQPRPAA